MVRRMGMFQNCGGGVGEDGTVITYLRPPQQFGLGNGQPIQGKQSPGASKMQQLTLPPPAGSQTASSSTEGSQAASSPASKGSQPESSPEPERPVPPQQKKLAIEDGPTPPKANAETPPPKLSGVVASIAEKVKEARDIASGIRAEAML